jgi:hypothetical protein
MSRFFRLVVVLLLIAMAAFSTVQSRAQGPANTEVVIQVSTESAGVVVYAEARMGASVVNTLPPLARVLWEGISVTSDGRNWLQISGAFGSGWITPETGQLNYIDPSRTTLATEVSAKIITTFPTNLYAAPNPDSSVIGALAPNTPLTIKSGPIEAGLYQWWEVEGANIRGWIPDALENINTTQNLRVYGVDVCDNSNISRFGVAGWDGLVNAWFSRIVQDGSRILCVVSSNLTGDGRTPIVTVAARKESSAGSVDTVYVFQKDGRGNWQMILNAPAEAFARIERISVHDFSNVGAGATLLAVHVRLDGTGGVLRYSLYQYREGTMQQVFAAEIYKGYVAVRGAVLSIFEPLYGSNEPNCCPSQVSQRVVEFRNGTFNDVLTRMMILPYALQGY